jgi:aromatic ring-cleaving dioxygenase
MIDSGKIRDYHAHIYYDPHKRTIATRLRSTIEKGFKVEMGRWHARPVGPHPRSMYQVKFARGEFSKILPWLMLNRGGLSVLVHPNTGDAYQDHAINALWLGKPLRLRLACLRPQRR